MATNSDGRVVTMATITSYGVEAARSLLELVPRVEQRIKEGWQPFGDVAVIFRSTNDKPEDSTDDVRE